MDSIELFHRFKKSYYSFVVDDLKRAETANLQVGLIILTLIGIDTLGGYFCGAESDDGTFRKFIKRFMPATYKPHAKTLYGFVRSGLLHNYVVGDRFNKSRGYLLTGAESDPHLQSRADDLIYLNRQTLTKDFFLAVDRYFLEVEHDAGLMAAALKRIRLKGFLEVSMESDSSIVYFTGTNYGAYEGDLNFSITEPRSITVSEVKKKQAK